MVAKISADKGVLFDFVNNEKIKASGFAVEGKTVNGYETDEGNIAINIESSKSLDSIVGHEITHIFEGTELYAELQKAVKEYATTKGEYTTRLQSLRKMYEGVYKGKDFDDKIRAELTADIVGEYLFTDADFINRLSVEKPNVFKKVYDEIKYLYKIATAGSKEARELERVKYQFEKAYKEAAKLKNTAEGGARYSIKYTRRMDYEEQIEEHFKGTLQGSNSIYIGEPSENLQKIGFSKNPFAMNQGDIKKSNKKSARNENYSRHGVPRKFFRGMPKYINEAVIFIENENGITVVTDYPILDKNDQPTYVIAGVLPDTTIDNDDVNLVKSVYPLDNFASKIEKAAETGKLVITDKQKARKMFATIGVQFSKPSNIFELSKDSISQNSEKSSETDNKYLSAVENGDTETAQRMVDEVAKENGYTIKAYHGTPNNEFTVFDKGRVGKGIDQYGAGFYFATNREAARGYGSRVIDSSLAINNPFKIDASSENGANLIDSGFDHLLTKKQAYEVIKRLPNIYDSEESILGDYYDTYWETGAQDWMIRDLASKESYRNIGYLDSDLFRDHPNELHEALREVVGYDGVEVSFDNGEKFYVAWFDNQMKSADAITYDDNGNVIPLSERFKTENNDIRYSLTKTLKIMENYCIIAIVLYLL